MEKIQTNKSTNTSTNNQFDDKSTNDTDSYFYNLINLMYNISNLLFHM